jgi:hypothetical protein
MAKQLEEALKRPISPTAPPQVGPAPLPPSREDEEVVDEDELLEPSTPQDCASAAPNYAAVPDGGEEEDLTEEGPGPIAGTMPPGPADPVRTVSPPPPVQPAPPPQAAEASAPSKPKVPDPFSVEEIEAEFARLLGRPLDPGKKG